MTTETGANVISRHPPLAARVRSHSRWRGENHAGHGCPWRRCASRSRAALVGLAAACGAATGESRRGRVPRPTRHRRRAVGLGHHDHRDRQHPALPPRAHLGGGLPPAVPGGDGDHRGHRLGHGHRGRVRRQGRYRRLRRLPVKRRPGDQPPPAQHPAGRLGPDRHLPRARAAGGQPPPAGRHGAGRDLHRDRSPCGTIRGSRRSTRTCRCRPLTIVPLHRSDRSGDTFLFTSYLSTQDPAWDDVDRLRHHGELAEGRRGHARAGSLAMLHGCAATAGCVAYNGISYLAQAQAAGLGEAALANSAGNFTLPTASRDQATRSAASCRSPRPTRRSR